VTYHIIFAVNRLEPIASVAMQWLGRTTEYL